MKLSSTYPTGPSTGCLPQPRPPPRSRNTTAASETVHVPYRLLQLETSMTDVARRLGALETALQKQQVVEAAVGKRLEALEAAPLASNSLYSWGMPEHLWGPPEDNVWNIPTPPDTTTFLTQEDTSGEPVDT